MYPPGECRCALTVVDDGGEEVVQAVQAGVQGEEEDHNDFVGEHNRRLHHMEAVAREGCGRGRPGRKGGGF